MKNLLIILAIVTLAGCGTVTPPEKQITKTKPVDAKEIASSAIPAGFKLHDWRSFGSNPIFVFGGYGDEQYKLELKVFVVVSGKVIKNYDSGVFEGEMIGFNDQVQNNSWGKVISIGVPVLPVSIYMGGNDWSRAYNKFFTVSGDNISEIPVECEPGTVAGAMLEDDDRLVVPVFDCRFQFFNDFIHAISPSRAYIFDYDANKKSFVDVTTSHLDYVNKRIEEIIKASSDGENKTDPQIQASSMVSIYTQAEAGGVISDNMPAIKELMQRFPQDPTVKKTWAQIEDAYKNKKPFATFAPWGNEMDYRWKKFDMKVETPK